MPQMPFGHAYQCTECALLSIHSSAWANCCKPGFSCPLRRRGSRKTKPPVPLELSEGARGRFERAAPTAADPEETVPSKRVVGCSANRAEIGLRTQFCASTMELATFQDPQKRSRGAATLLEEL